LPPFIAAMTSFWIVSRIMVYRFTFVSDSTDARI
jgi:hypothetical protein